MAVTDTDRLSHINELLLVSRNWTLWIVWLTSSAGIAALLWSALPTEDSANAASRVFLPGETTCGHYQIELKCAACHEIGGAVREQSCLDCHENELKEARDTHKASKFSDPTKAELLQHIDATSCIACHKEHVPDQTLEMGLTMPDDYCWHCHQTIAEDRPSHANFTYDSCATAGCHNFHDNRTLNENFLFRHALDPQHWETQLVPTRSEKIDDSKSLAAADHDGPPDSEPKIIVEWAQSWHAKSGINCTGCHRSNQEAGTDGSWQAAVNYEACRECHQSQTEGFLSGRHGMRLAAGLEPMQPQLARCLPMRSDAAHRKLTCNACHPAHDYDVQRAAVESCLQCHADSHSRAYKEMEHYRLWQQELENQAPAGTGVSCATCHLPRVQKGQAVTVQHNQNANLRPNEKMLNDVCLNCHGLSFSLDSLADPNLVGECYGKNPEVHIDSIELVRKWFDSKGRKPPKPKQRNNQ